MALTRLAAFATGSVLTSSQLTSEFDNIYNNALTLISPLTGSLSFGGFNANNIALGSAAAPSINWTGNTNTGFFSPAANQVGIAVAGVAAANFTAAAAGPHVVGSGTTNTRYAFLHTGTITLSGATQEAGIASDQALTNASGVNLYGMFLAQTLTNVAGATTTMAWLAVSPSALTITAGSVTNAAGLYIAAAPSGATNNYALWVVAGQSRFGNQIVFDSSAPTISLPGVFSDGGQGVFLSFQGGTTGTRWYNSGLGAERMRLTDAGILLLGTTVTTGAGAGDFVMTGAGTFRLVNAAGTGLIRTLERNASDQILLSGSGNDIMWGRALVALGAGGAATLGNTGGSGPATTTQNTWMRVIDSTGVAFWVPAWK